MAALQPPHLVHDVLVEKGPFPRANAEGRREGAHFDLALQHVNELQVLVPVHHLKAGVAGAGGVVHNAQHQVRKAGVQVQVDRIEVPFARGVHGGPF